MDALELQFLLADDMKLYKGRIGDVDNTVAVHVTVDVVARGEVVVGGNFGTDGRAVFAEHCLYALALVFGLHVINVPVIVICFGNQVGEGLLKDLKGNRSVALADNVKHEMYNRNRGAVCFHKELGIIAVAEIEPRFTVAQIKVCNNRLGNGTKRVILVLVHVGLLAEPQYGGVIVEIELTVDDAVLRRFQIVVHRHLLGNNSPCVADGSVIVKEVGLRADSQSCTCLRPCRVNRKCQTADAGDNEQRQRCHHRDYFVFHRETPS